MQCVYVNLNAPTYIKVIYPTARDIAQAAYRRALSKKGEPSQCVMCFSVCVMSKNRPYLGVIL